MSVVSFRLFSFLQTQDTGRRDASWCEGLAKLISLIASIKLIKLSSRRVGSEAGEEQIKALNVIAICDRHRWLSTARKMRLSVLIDKLALRTICEWSHLPDGSTHPPPCFLSHQNTHTHTHTYSSKKIQWRGERVKDTDTSPWALIGHAKEEIPLWTQALASGSHGWHMLNL